MTPREKDSEKVAWYLCKKASAHPENIAAVTLQALRRDWAVLVLDAWVRERFNYQYALERYRGLWRVKVQHSGGTQLLPEFATPAEARHAAAEAVFPTLEEAARAELGECP